MKAMSISLNSTIPLRSGASIPQLGYGVYQARGQECEKGVEEALQLGYRHIDSAQAYRNEKLVGDNVADRASTFLTTKYMSTHQAHSSEAVYKELVKSVPKLNKGKTSEEGGYIDLMLIHAPFGGEKGRAENWAALARAQKEGWVRDIGVSNFGVKHLEALPGPAPAVNQIEIHPWCQQRPIVEYCQKHGIVLQAYSPLSRAMPERMNDETVNGIAKKHGKEWGQIMIRWSLQKGYVPLPKSVTPSRIKSNSEVYDFELDPDDMSALDGLDLGAKGASTWNPVDVD